MGGGKEARLAADVLALLLDDSSEGGGWCRDDRFSSVLLSWWSSDRCFEWREDFSVGGERRLRLEEVLGGGIGGEFSSSETGRWELPWAGGEAGGVGTGAAWVEDSGVSFIAGKAEARFEATAETVT